jgi:hypothetical protein
MSDSDDAGRSVTVTMLAGGRCRIDYGDAAGGRYAIGDYSDLKDYILGLRPRSDLVEIYGLADLGQERSKKKGSYATD